MTRPTPICILITLLLAALTGCYQPEQPPENPVAAWILQLLPENPAQQRRVLLEQLSSPDADQRRLGVMALTTEIPDQPELVARILAIMAAGDVDPAVRADALEQRANLDQPEGFRELLDDAARDPSPRVRTLAANLLADFPNDRAALDTLAALLRDDPDENTRAAAANALAGFREPDAIAALLAGLADPAFRVQYRARNALVELTGRDFQYDIIAWRQWLGDSNKQLPQPAG